MTHCETDVKSRCTGSFCWRAIGVQVVTYLGILLEGNSLLKCRFESLSSQEAPAGRC